MPSDQEDGLVEGRACGDCTVCCTDLNIDEPELVKLSGHQCVNCTSSGCGIYGRRPSVCQEFYCGWRRIPWLGEAWRPDRIGIMLRFLDPDEACPDEQDVEIAIAFDLRRPDRQLIGLSLAEACGTLIDAGIATFLTVPGAPGHAAGRVHLNVPLAPILATRNASAIVQALGLAFDVGLQHAKDPVSFRNRPGDVE